MMQNAVSLLLALGIGANAPPTNATFAFKQPLTREIVLKWLPAVCLFTVMLISSLETLKHTSVATAIVVR